MVQIRWYKLIFPCSCLLSVTINLGNNAMGNKRKTLKSGKGKADWLEIPGLED